MKTLKELNRGDLFKLRENGKIYVRGEYLRGLKQYEYYDYEDVNKSHCKKGETKVIEDWNWLS